MDKGRILFNVGSVGNPCDHITMASYVALEGKINSRTKSDFSIQFQRVSDNIDLAIEHGKSIDLPKLESYIKELTIAVYSR
jgi:protein phosphatase